MKSQLIYEAIGRRKSATAKVSLINGSGNILINDQVAEKYFQYNLINNLL